MKKIFLLVLCSLAFLGCVSVKTTVDNETTEYTMGEGKASAGEACESDIGCDQDEGPMACLNGRCTSVECRFVDDCEAEDDICFAYNCYTENELYAEYERCYPGKDPEMQCNQTCAGCEDGTQKCIGSSAREGSLYLCADCITDYNCKDGYKCEARICIPE